MQLPIVAYGRKILKEQCRDIDATYPGLEQLIHDMWETLYKADGCGLAAPQVEHSIRLFVVDSKQTYQVMDKEERRTFFAEEDQGITETFINARILHYSTQKWIDQEGCLSIPSIREAVEKALANHHSLP